MLAVALLFLAYLQVSRTYPENSDESNDLLMAWDMLHGNVLLHGWYLSDVSFITTELPQYVLLERLFGLHTDTAHIAAAMTYTLVVLLAVLLARAPGQSRREAGPRMLLTAGLMFAPQLGVGVFVLLLSLGHIGTAVPLLLTWLVIDRCPARWYVPVVVGLLLTWVLVADPLVLLVGVMPLVAVCAMRVARELSLARRQDGRDRCAGRPARPLVRAVPGRGGHPRPGPGLGGRPPARASGGFLLHPVPYQLAPVHTWPKHAWVTAEGLLALFGAKPQGPAAALAFALLHLAGVALVAWAMLRVARHFCQLAGHDQPDPARRDGRQRGRVRAEHAGQRDRPERPGVRRRAAVRRGAGRPDAGGQPPGRHAPVGPARACWPAWPALC